MCGVSRLYIFAAYMVLKHSDRKERGGGEKGTTKENGESCFEERLQVRKRQRGKRGNGRTILRGGGNQGDGKTESGESEVCFEGH